MQLSKSKAPRSESVNILLIAKLQASFPLELPAVLLIICIILAVSHIWTFVLPNLNSFGVFF